MKKEPKEDYKEYVVRWKNVASLVQPPLTNREENSMFVETLPSPYYDMLVVNDFVEFEDLMYSVGRIEDGIRKGKIMDTGASIQEKKMIILNEHNGGLNKRKPSAIEESVGNLSRSSLCTPYAQVPYVGLPLSQRFASKCDQESDSSYPRDNKRKRIKVYHSLPMTYGELLPMLIHNYRIFVIPARPKRPPYSKGNDVNARCEYHGEVGGHSVENCMAFKDKVQYLINADPTKFRELINGHQKC